MNPDAKRLRARRYEDVANRLRIIFDELQGERAFKISDSIDILDGEAMRLKKEADDAE